MKKQYISIEDITYQLSNLKQLTFEVTDACNLNCQYCAYGELYSDYDKREDKRFNLSAAIKLIDYLAPFWNSRQNVSTNHSIYISFYGGEPLLNMPFIKSVVKYIKGLHCPRIDFLFSMTTNALLLERNMDYLVEHKFNLLVSLDGGEYNTSYRVNKSGKPAFHDIIKNVDALRKKYPHYFEEKVNFNAVLHNRNSVDEIYSYLKEHYNKIPSIGELNTMGIRPDKTALFRDTYRNTRESLHQSENYEAIEEDMFLRLPTFRTVTDFIYRYSGFVYHDYPNLLVGNPTKKIPTGTCLPFSRRMFVTVNGKIMPCERIGQQYALGSVSESGVELDFEAIAGKYNSYFAKLSEQCSRCFHVNACIQCIFNLEDLEGCPQCEGFMNKQRFEEYKKRQMDFLRKHPEQYYRIMEEVIVD